MEAPLYLKLMRCKSFAQDVRGNIKISGNAYDDTAATNQVFNHFNIERCEITVTAYTGFSVISNTAGVAAKSLVIQAAFHKIIIEDTKCA